MTGDVASRHRGPQILVPGLARAKDDEGGVEARELVGHFGNQVEAFLIDHARDHADERSGNRLLVGRQPVSRQQRALVRGFSVQMFGVVRRGKMRVVPVAQIEYITADGPYAELHVGTHRYLIRESMQHLEEKLDPEWFLRIHRSTIVNIERIQELQPWFHGDYVVLLRDGTKLTLSRGYRQKLQDLFGNAL